MAKDFLQLLRAAVQENNLVVSPEQIDKCLIHYQLLQRWGAVHNLTAIDDVEEVVKSHYLDCFLGLKTFAPPHEIVDIGSGAGFPGIIAAILWPKSKIILVEASRKKCSFLRIAILELGLANAVLLNKRAEDVAPITMAMTRATFGAENLANAAALFEKNGLLLAFVGASWKNIESGVEGFSVVDLVKYSWSGIKTRAVAVLRRT